MTAQTNNLPVKPVHSASLTVRMLQGAAIGLVLILTFVLRARTQPEWGQFWMIQPLIVTPLAGAMGGLGYYMMDHLRAEGGWKKALGIFLSLIGYLIALWMGIVLGLHGTMWN